MSGSRCLNHCPYLKVCQANQRGLELLLQMAAFPSRDTNKPIRASTITFAALHVAVLMCSLAARAGSSVQVQGKEALGNFYLLTDFECLK